MLTSLCWETGHICVLEGRTGLWANKVAPIYNLARLEAIALRLEAIASRLEATALRLEAIALEATALRLEAFASMLEAIALRLERLGAIASRLEATALRLEAIASRFLLVPGAVHGHLACQALFHLGAGNA